MRLIGDKLSAVRGTRTLFAGLSFSVGRGETLLVMGPNGAGKTTLLRMIGGFVAPSAGRLLVQEAEPDQALGEACHYVGHANAIKTTLTVAENITFWARFLAGSVRDVGSALETFGLAALRDIPAGYLSAGQKRRLGLARLCVAQRPLWLLDEPTASLDSAAQGALEAAARRHLESGGIIVAATHVPLGFGPARELVLGSAAPAA